MIIRAGLGIGVRGMIVCVVMRVSVVVIVDTIMRMIMVRSVCHRMKMMVVMVMSAPELRP